MCHSNGTFIFSQEEEERGHEQGLDVRSVGQWPKNPPAMGSGDSE